MRKKLLIFLFISIALIAFSPQQAIAADDGLDTKIDEQLSNLDTEELERHLENLTETQRKMFGGTTFKQRLQSVISGDFKIGYDSFFSALLSVFLSGIFGYLPVFSAIIAICALCGIITRLKPSFLSEGTSEIIFFAAYAAAVLLITGALFSLIGEVKQSVETLKSQMDIGFPILLTLMAASGGVVSVSVYKPAAAFLSGAIVQVMYTAVLPLTVIIALFSIVGNMSGSVKLDKFIDLFKSANKWIIGVCLTVFSVFLSVQGVTSASYDGISFRAAKYAISNSVPIVGGFLRDGFDLILAGSVIIKNAAGSALLILLAVTVLVPVLHIAAFGLFTKLTAAVAEPLGDGRIPALLTSLSGAVNYLTAVLLSVSFMYFITVMLFVCSSNSFF